LEKYLAKLAQDASSVFRNKGSVQPTDACSGKERASNLDFRTMRRYMLISALSRFSGITQAHHSNGPKRHPFEMPCDSVRILRKINVESESFMIIIQSKHFIFADFYK